MQTGSGYREVTANNRVVVTHTPPRHGSNASSGVPARREPPARGLSSLGTFWSNAATVLAPGLASKYADGFFKVGVPFDRSSVDENKVKFFLKWPPADQDTQLAFMRASGGRVKFVNSAPMWRKRTGQPGGFLDADLFCTPQGGPVGA